MQIRFLVAAAAAFSGFLMGPSARAQAVWIGNNTTYFDATNWQGGVLPANDGSATLDLSYPIGIDVIYISQNVNVLGIQFTGSGQSNYQLNQNFGTGATLTIGTGGVSVQSGLNPTEAFGIPVILSGNQTWDGTGGYVVAYDNVGEVGGPRTLSTMGSVYLLGGSTFTGGVNIETGNL
ncbi:MAG TPA: hypothetical protein VFE25_09205, partial [Opitutaceae bacterium]|nr:hypothetical protein [Opitutaceae bacterium]